MEIYMLEYDEETDYDGFGIEKYSLIGLYCSEAEAQGAKKRIATKMHIDESLLFISSTKMNKLQWKEGFVTE